MTLLICSSSRGYRLLFAVCCLITMTACSALTPYPKLNAFGAKELLNQQIEEIDLVVLLGGSHSNDSSKTDPNVEIENALREFKGTPARRTQIQERILLASEQRCGRYKIFLKQFDGETNFVLGSITTALAGAGALVPPALAARALAGAAGVTSGINAEFNDKLFAQLTIQVLTKAIDARRKSFYEQVILPKRTKPDGTFATLEEYPVEAAIKDALTYHADCSLIAGLEEAAVSIDRSQNIGLEQLDKLQKKYPNLGLFKLSPDNPQPGTSPGVK